MMKEIHENHAIHKIGYHIVWCPKFRHQVLADGVEVELKHIIHQTCTEYGWNIVALEVMPDHVHLFVQCDHQTRPVDVAKTIKSISAVYIFTKFPKLKQRKFWGTGLWSRGTYYGSVGDVSSETVARYIETQQERNS